MMPIRRLAACTLGLAAFAAGATPARAASLFGGSRPGVVEVGVRELPAEDAWQATWRLPEKAAGVDFVHGRGGYRRAGWAVPAGARWVDAPGVERLCFARPSRDLAVAFRSDFAERPKDYEATVALSDGGRLLYTGQLVVRPLQTCDAAAADASANANGSAIATPTGSAPASPSATSSAPASTPPGTALATRDGELLHRFQFTTTTGRTVRVLDQAAAGALAWRPASGEERTYVYFGPQAVATGERLALIADPALPDWMHRQLEPTVAKIFDRFAGETGMALPVRPFVVVSFTPTGSGFSFGGGQLGAMLQLAFAGEGLRADTAETRVYFVKHLAHELFHLWDGFTLRADAESEWLSEAAAEAFALRAAYGLGVLDARQVAARLVDLGNQCLAGLDGQSLLSAPQRQAWDTWYSCGPVLLFVAGQAVERKHPGEGGLGLLVREMFAEGRAAGGVYGTGTFLGWLDKLSGDRATVFALQGLIRRGVPRGADRLLAQLLAGAGYRVVLVAPSEAKASPEVFGVMLRKALARCACGPTGATAAGAAVDGDCARLSGPAPLVSVGDVEVRRDPAAAYDRLRAGAGLGRPVRVVAGDDPQPLTLFCGRDALDASFDQLLRLQD